MQLWSLSIAIKHYNNNVGTPLVGLRLPAFLNTECECFAQGIDRQGIVPWLPTSAPKYPLPATLASHDDLQVQKKNTFAPGRSILFLV